MIRMFQVRIVTVDHYMSSPIRELDVTYSDFRKSSVKHVPVIRIFGATPSGVKTCVHVHGVFPYICIPYDGSEPHQKLSYQLANSLDKAINIASGFSTANTQHVYKVVLVSGIPFYGYHDKRHQFLKVYFYKPNVIKQAVNLLQNGAILNKVFQPHEAHIPFLLQFFIDFNLYGMSFIDFQQVKFRRTNFPDLFSNIPEDQMLPDTIRAVSTSHYEVDAAACHISNRPSSQGNGQICNPGIAAIWEDENRRRAMKEGTPVDIPHLHSQRPPQNSTSSELFHLDRIQRILNNPSQSSDDSVLSGEQTLTNKSYAIEEPPNVSTLDASFVSLHVSSDPGPNVQAVTEADHATMADDTIVDEDLALLNSSLSQHISQPLDKSLALDFEDLELLDVLETLANTRTTTVDDDSILGSQTSKTSCRPCVSVGDEEEANSEGEEEHWNDKTLVVEEDDPRNLFDLTMPDIDENEILNAYRPNEPEPGPSTPFQDGSQIPQVDGNSDKLCKRNRKARRMQCHIPQVDGANDIPSKSGRKSLGVRFGRSQRQVRSKDSALNDGRYIPGTKDLIFQKKKNPDLASAFVNQDTSSQMSSTVPCNDQVLKKTDEVGPSFVSPIQETTVNTMQEELLYILPSPEEEAVRPCSSLAAEELLQPYYPDLQPHVSCCTSTVACSEDTDEHCTDTFIDLLANKRKDPILRGDPSLYPQAPLEKEESLNELISSVVSGENNSAAVKLTGEIQVQSQEPSSTSIRRSSRLSVSSRELSQPRLMEAKDPPNDNWSPARIGSSANVDLLEVPDGNMTPGSMSDISVSGIAPLLTTTMFDEIRGTLDWGSSNTDASCSDSELCRLKNALDNNEMEEILQGSEASIPVPSTSRREELLLFMAESSQTSNQDPVTDELLHRGELPRKGPPMLGKNMALAQLHCGIPIHQNKRQSRVSNTVNKKEQKRVQRENRRLKLSVSAQREKRNERTATLENPEMQPCSVKIERLTKKNIYRCLRKWHVVLKDKSALGINCRKSSTTNTSELKPRPLLTRSKAVTKYSVLSSGRTRKSELMKRPLDSSKPPNLQLFGDESGFNQTSESVGAILAPISNASTPPTVNGNIKMEVCTSNLLRPRRKAIPQNSSVSLENLKEEVNGDSSAAKVMSEEKEFSAGCNFNQSISNTDAVFPQTLCSTQSNVTPQKYIATPGSNPTSIKILCTSQMQSEGESSERDEISPDDMDDLPLIKRTKKLKLKKKKKNMILFKGDQTSSESEGFSCAIVANSQITTSTSSQKCVEISLAAGSMETVSDLHPDDRALQELNNIEKKKDEPTSIKKNDAQTKEFSVIQTKSKDPIDAKINILKTKSSKTQNIKKTCFVTLEEVADAQRKNAINEKKSPKKPGTSHQRSSSHNKPNVFKDIDKVVKGSIKMSSTTLPGSSRQRRISGGGKKYTVSVLKPKPIETNGKNEEPSSKPVALSCRRESNSSIKYEDIVPVVQPFSKNFKIPKKQDLKDLSEDLANVNESTNDSLLVSLETSSIELLSSSGDENVCVAAPERPLCSPVQSSQKTSCQILSVDGASTESNSDSSSGSQGAVEESKLSHQPIKRKIAEEDVQHENKVQRESNEGVPDWQRPGTLREKFSEATARWFDKRYPPWTFWSPHVSPVSRPLKAHDCSPPRPFTPGNCSDSNFTGFTAMTHGCMEESSANDNKLPSTPGQDLDMHLKVLESSGVDSERNSKVQTETEPSSVLVDNSLRKSSHSSSQDMFSERSFHLHEDDIAEENKSHHDVFLTASSCSNFSLSGSVTDKEKLNCNEPEENLFLVSSKTSEAVDAPGEENKLDADAFSLNASSQCNILVPEDGISSHGSYDIPCGQATRKESSQEIVPTKISDFKTMQKPPSRKEVLNSLSALNLPEVVTPEPYFSNYLDVKGKVDVGRNVLDLTSNNCLHLEEFRSGIDGLRGLGYQQRQLFARCWGLSQVKGNFNQLISTHFNEKVTVISPVKKPPKVSDVAVWAKAKEMALKARKPYGGATGGVNEEKETNQKIISQSSHKESPGKTVESSTPESSLKKAKRRKMPSPLLTPILTRSQSKANRKSVKILNTLTVHPSPLPSVTEKDENDLGVWSLDSEVPVEVSNNPQCESLNNSVKPLVLDSQFCQEAVSPLFRHNADASACQIKGISASPGFKMVLENLQTAKTEKQHQYITTLTMEVHICTCGALNPDPERDPIRAIFYCVCNDVPEKSDTPASVNGIIAVNSKSSTPLLNRCGISGEIEYVIDEKSLLQSLVSLVHKWDPDILAGFEIEMLSWGYVLQRACVLGMNITQEFSRIRDQKQGKQEEDYEDNNGVSGLKITGRIVLDAWRLFRSEVALQSYTFENLMYHILHKRVCHHSFESLSRWWEHPSHLHRWITVQYYQLRVSGIIGLLDQLDIIGRTSELARLFGIQFFEVLSRGSQFRVESMMLRLAKPLNFIPISPSVQQRAHMRAPECLPLIMEPESRFYNDPMIVLDFQSLYPSMIIAYNYCFSTCLGRVEHLGKQGHFEFGCSELRVKNSLLRRLKDNISVSPSGIAFVSKRVRQGVLPRMLEEILEARLAVKQSMKLHKKDHTLQRVLHARQLGLKLIANVTYGYTSANFSGRMPCIEVGDSVVSKGRETLERAIALVHNNKDWQARVVYGDTDSLFVLIPGRSREEAFRIGAEIASAVTQDNPSPVKLKLEKVYQPCILQTKKRYVGFMYESPDQVEPVYEAKGIETVRRDGCPAVAKMLEKSLKILFETRDVSSVKNYVSHQFSKILAGRANIQDLIFAREYRGKENYRAGACVPALELTKRWLRQDRRAEPRIGERVPYVVTNGPPGSALIHLVRHPKELLSDPSLRYNAVYYVTRAIIPPLARCFSLLGADVLSWFSDLPRKNYSSLPAVNQAGCKKTISQYFSTMECACCGTLTHGGVCARCQTNSQLLATTLMSKLHSLELTHTSITKICQSCLGRSAPLDCSSLDCPITYRRHQSAQKHEQTAFISHLLNEFGLP